MSAGRTPGAALSPCARALARPDLSWKIVGQAALVEAARSLQRAGRRVVFTNGCFDLLHVGHVRYLQAARELGDALVVAVNSDASVRRLGKGRGRPVNPARDRAEVLAALAAVDYVTIFGDDTPLRLIRRVQPDVLVKGGDWSPGRIVGREVVEARGGRVLSLPLVRGRSTTRTLARIRKAGR